MLYVVRGERGALEQLRKVAHCLARGDSIWWIQLHQACRELCLDGQQGVWERHLRQLSSKMYRPWQGRHCRAVVDRPVEGRRTA